MDSSLQRKLRRLGLVKGVQQLKPPATPSPAPEMPGPSYPHTGPLPGGPLPTPHGPTWVWQRHYGADHHHGIYPLGALQHLSPHALTLLGANTLGPRPAFLDTETTGLVGGAGTLIFLIGVGLWEGDHVRLHLIFLRTPDEERAALHYLAELLRDVSGLVTFNGTGFDLPILENRFILQRMAPSWRNLPHLDLLTVARLLWSEHLPSRRLSALEQALLGIERAAADLPSWMIPTAYREYLHTGHTEEMHRIFYHNEMDVLSMMTLLIHCAQRLDIAATARLAAGEWVGVGRLYERAGYLEQAEAAWRQALEEDNLPSDVAARLWQALALRRKQAGAWEAALALWEAWAQRLPCAIEPLVERAKYFEWIAHDPVAALRETEQALKRAAQLPRGLAREQTLAELRHRQQRLQRKLERQET